METHPAAMKSPIELLEEYIINRNKANMAALKRMSEAVELDQRAEDLKEALEADGSLGPEVLDAVDLTLTLCGQFQAVEIMETRGDEIENGEFGRVSRLDRMWNRQRRTRAKNALYEAINLSARREIKI